MSNRGSYDTDTFVSFVVRCILYSAILAVVPFGIAACSNSATQGGRLNAAVNADYQPYSAGGSSDQTRNPLPQRGADEKSDSSLTKPPI